MQISFFRGLIILSILVLIGGVGGSVDVLSDNHIVKGGQVIHQYLVYTDSDSMSPGLNPGDLVVLENTSNISTGDIILYQAYGDKDLLILQRAIGYVREGEPMWKDGPAAPFDGYITKGDNNGVIDQMAGQILGMANTSYLDEHRGEIVDVGSGIYRDANTDLIIYQMQNGTYVGDGISYLVPVRKEWVVGVVKNEIPGGSDWATLSPKIPNSSQAAGVL